MAIVTISRGSMSGGRQLAECVARAAGLPCVGREIVVEAAARLGVTHNLLQAKIEKSPGFFERFSSERHSYLLAVQTALAAHAASGNLVYHGQAGHLLLCGLPGILRVRLIAPLEVRVRAVVEALGLSEQEAESHIHALDAERVRWTRAMYGVDIADPSLYDLVINLDRLSLGTACEAIRLVLKQPEYEMTDEVSSKLREFAASCRAQLESHLLHRGLSTPSENTRVLIVDDDEGFASFVAEHLPRPKYEVAVADSTRDALCRVGAEAFDVVLLGLQSDTSGGMATLREMHALDRSVEIVVLAGRGTVAAAIEGMLVGAADFLQKPVGIEHLCRSIDAAAETTRHKRTKST